jgi:hypothetical protein
VGVSDAFQQYQICVNDGIDDVREARARRDLFKAVLPRCSSSWTPTTASSCWSGVDHVTSCWSVDSTQSPTSGNACPTAKYVGRRVTGRCEACGS